MKLLILWFYKTKQAIALWCDVFDIRSIKKLLNDRYPIITHHKCERSLLSATKCYDASIDTKKLAQYYDTNK